MKRNKKNMYLLFHARNEHWCALLGSLAHGTPKNALVRRVHGNVSYARIEL